MLSRARRTASPITAWPGYVDVLSALLMVVIFVLMIFVVAQFLLSEVLYGQKNELARLHTQVNELVEMLGLEKVTMRSGRVNLFFEEQHRLSRSEVESLRKATDQPMEFSLLGHPRITLDLGQVNQHQRLAYLRGVLSKAV